VVDADSCGTFKTNSIRFTILFSGFAELLHNAVKYADGEAPIESPGFGKATIGSSGFGTDVPPTRPSP